MVYTANPKQNPKRLVSHLLACIAACCALVLFGCGWMAPASQHDKSEAPATQATRGEEARTAEERDPQAGASGEDATPAPAASDTADDTEQDAADSATEQGTDAGPDAASDDQDPAQSDQPTADELRQSLSMAEDYRPSFVHGEKPAENQKYIVLHDTEGGGTAVDVIDYWDSNGAGVASHFIINKDGSIAQCVPLDKIAHHAGFGDAGHNELFGVQDESRDDKVGTVSIGPDYPDYGMNSWSIGVEMVHMGAETYPEEQLQALDRLIAYIDAYYGFESSIIDHKAWRTTNSDTSPEFAAYLANYQATRTYNGA